MITFSIRWAKFGRIGYHREANLEKEIINECFFLFGLWAEGNLDLLEESLPKLFDLLEKYDRERYCHIFDYSLAKLDKTK